MFLCTSDNDVLGQTIFTWNPSFIANTSDDVENLLSSLYKKWVAKGSISFFPNHFEIKKYSRKAQAEIFCKALNEL